MSVHNTALQEKGIFGDDDLLKFKTLYELQDHACVAFAENSLFGTFAERGKDKGQFEWMNYADYGHKVNLCRSVLKDLGKFLMRVVSLSVPSCKQGMRMCTCTRTEL